MRKGRVQKIERWRRAALLFFLSQSVTLFGSQVVQMAVIWHVTLLTSSGIWVAAYSVCSYLPQFFLSFPAGVWADRFDRKRLIITADLGIAFATGVMMLIVSHMDSEKQILVALLFLSMVRSAGSGIQIPAVSAVVPQLVSQEELGRYNGFYAAMQAFVQFAAPAVAGLLLGSISLEQILWVDIVTAGIGTVMFVFVSIPGVPGKSKSEEDFIDTNMKSGLLYVAKHKTVRHLLQIYGIFTFLCVPAGYLSGLFVSRMFGNSYFYLTATEVTGFGGMMAGGIWMSLHGSRKDGKKVLGSALFFFGVMAVGMAVSKKFAVYLLCMMLYGVALTAVQTTLTTLLQKQTDPDMQGRIFGLMGAAYAACYPAGMAVFGTMSDWLPLRWLMCGSGFLLLLLAGKIRKS